MKSSYILAIVIIVSVALVIGRFFDNSSPSLATNTLKVPDNIDYYLSNLKYSSMNQQGSLQYLLQSPYLEHYIQQDTSQLTRPTMQFYGQNSEWHIQAQTGRLQHKINQFEWQQQVKLERNSQQPMLLTTQAMILKADHNLIEIPSPVNVVTNNLKFNAASAVLRLQQNSYQFKRVNATYHLDNLNRTTNEQS